MAFFQNASGVTILGGNFINNEGKLTLNDHSQNTNNLNSNNRTTSNVINSHNDNSARISGSDVEIPPRSADYREGDYTPPQPQRPRFSPPQIPSNGGGTAINVDSFNGENRNTNGSFNDNSRNYYRGGAPPDNRRQNNGPNWMSGFNQGLPATSGLHGSGQFSAPGQGPFHPQQMGVGGPPGSHMSVINPNIQHMGHMGQDFGKWIESTISQTQSMAAGISGGNQAANASSSRNVEGNDSMNNGMANLSLNNSQPQIPTHLSSPTSFASGRQVGLKPTDQMGSLNPSTSYTSPYNIAAQQGSQFNPSLGPRMNEPNMPNLLSPPTETRSYGNNLNRPPPPTSTSPSNFQPSFSVGPDSNLTIEDRSVNHTNMGSFNENNNTVRDSHNDNSLVDTTGKHYDVPTETKKKKKSRAKPSPDPTSSIPVDEEPIPEETDEQIPTATESIPTVAESTVDSSAKEKKTRKLFWRK